MTNDNISDELKIYELSLIWKEAEYNFAFWERLADSLEWDKAYKTALSAVLKTKNLHEYYLELMKFLALLRDGHTGVWFPKSIEDSAEYTAKLPIRTQLIGGERVIVDVKRCVADKVKQWSVIKRVNGVEMEKYADKNIYPYVWHEKKDSIDYGINNFLSCGAAGSIVDFELEYDGKIETVSLTRTKGDVDWVYGNTIIKSGEKLRQEYTSDSHRIVFTDDNIAIVTIDTMMNGNLPKEFSANFSLLEKARGYIIDIRNNGGGNSGYADPVAAVFIGGEFVNQRALHPIHIGVYKAYVQNAQIKDKTYEQLAEQYGDSEDLKKLYKFLKHAYYEEDISKVNSNELPGIPGVLTAPLVVLTSAYTASAAEDFLIELDHAKRITIVGSASCGSTGQPIRYDLESGGGFRICTRHNTYPDGREFINIGVKPHIPFEMTIQDYKNGIDSVMNKGLEIVRKLI